MNLKKFLVAGLLATSLFGSNLNAQEATTTTDAEKFYRYDALYVSYIVMPRLSANNDNDDSLNLIFDNCKNYFNDAIKHLNLNELSWLLKTINDNKKYCLELEIVDGTKENYDDLLNAFQKLIDGIQQEILLKSPTETFDSLNQNDKNIVIKDKQFSVLSTQDIIDRKFIIVLASYLALGEVIPSGYNKNINTAFDDCKTYIIKNISHVSIAKLNEFSKLLQQGLDEYYKSIEALKKQKEDSEKGLPLTRITTYRINNLEINKETLAFLNNEIALRAQKNI